MLHELDMAFNYEPIKYGTIKEGNNNITPKMAELFDYVEKGEKDFVKAWNRKNNPGQPEKRMHFNSVITYDDDVMQTVTGDHGSLYDYSNRLRVSDKSVSNASTFPQDYDFCGERIPYICGMSVPPIMMKSVVTRLIEKGVFDYKLKKGALS